MSVVKSRAAEGRALASRRRARTAALEAAHATLAPTQLRYLNERVTREIGLRILNGTYRPGDTIPSELDFCVELGVSRTALREAIKFLFSKGLVTPRVKVGTIVNPRRQWNFFDPTVLEWLLEVGDIGPFLVKLWALRKTMEPAAAALAAENATFDDFEALHRALEAMEAGADDPDAWVAADLRFHQAIYAATGNEFFWPVGRLLAPAFAAGLRVTVSAQHQQQCLPEHRAVHDAILARDPARAHQAVVELMRTSEADLSQGLSGVKGAAEAD